MFYSFQLSLQSTKITLCSPTPIQFPKNSVSLLTIYPGSYCTSCQDKPRQGLQWLFHYFLCWCEMTNISSIFFISQTFSWHWQKTQPSFQNTLMWYLRHSNQSLSCSFKALSCTTLLPNLGAHICTWQLFSSLHLLLAPFLGSLIVLQLHNWSSKFWKSTMLDFAKPFSWICFFCYIALSILSPRVHLKERVVTL